jgi:hypothetical protein
MEIEEQINALYDEWKEMKRERNHLRLLLANKEEAMRMACSQMEELERNLSELRALNARNPEEEEHAPI